MKRPEGFDAAPQHPPAEQKPSRGRKARGQKSSGAPEQSDVQKPRPAAKSGPAQSRPPAQSDPEPNPLRIKKQPGEQKPASEKKRASKKPSSEKPSSEKPSSEKAAAARAENSARKARKAAGERRRYERDEVRRFTRRSRHRRAAWITAGAVVAALVGTVTIAVYSPLLALTKIEVTGTSSVDPAEVLDAVDGQLGTPLALVDSDRLTRELAKFTLIQSYVTETVPPHTLIIHVTERQPIGSVTTASGFTVVDPAGVTITEADVRPEGIPVIELAGSDVGSDVFDSVVEVLLALPDSVGARVDRVTAATKDDVTLVFSTGQRVVWGSAEESNLKARVLAALMATQSESAKIEYDVSAPLSAVIRPA
jgi:cell division protein FtsQ